MLAMNRDEKHTENDNFKRNIGDPGSKSLTLWPSMDSMVVKSYFLHVKEGLWPRN
jgi:hypothetical protein